MGEPTPSLLMIAPPAGMATAIAKAMPAGKVESVEGEAEGLRRLRQRAFDVVVTSPSTSVTEDLALLEEARRIRPGLSMIVLAPRTTPEEIIASLREKVFACLGPPHEPSEIAGLARQAMDATDWRNGIEVLSATRDWISLRLSCRLMNAERLLLFLREFRSDVPEEDREAVMLAFREILLNALEHGARFDADKVIEISAVRTARAIVYYVHDPGPGFRLDEIAHAAAADPERGPLELQDARHARGLRPGGFGILLAQKVVDELFYSERGNEVILIKHTDHERGPA